MPQDEALLLAELDALPTEQQQTLATWLFHHPEQPALLVSAPCSALEGQLRAAGLTPSRLDASHLNWVNPSWRCGCRARGSPSPKRSPGYRSGEWPLAWQLWQQPALALAIPQPCWNVGAGCLTQTLNELPAPLPEALALQADYPQLDEARVLLLAGCSRGQWQPLRCKLLNAGWLLEEAHGDRWQPRC